MQEITNIQLYQSQDGIINVNAHIEHDTIWLTEQQMGILFGKSRRTINEHIHNIYNEQELTKEESYISILNGGNSATGSNKPTMYYNLDVIISVGYRVKSIEGVKFRKRANSILKDHILNGYSFNSVRLAQTGLDQLYTTLDLIKKTVEQGNLNFTESQGLIELMVSYIPSLITLNQYDSNTLSAPALTNEQHYNIDIQEAYSVLETLKTELINRDEATELFALPRESGLESIIGAIYQSYDEHDVYPSVEEKAANLLYLTIKNHPFIDGNKRSGAFLFVWYLSRNNCLYKPGGSLKISEQTLVALALLVASSNPSDKELMIQLIMVLLQ